MIVEVAVFNPKIGPDAHGQEPGADIALYPARHGIRAEVLRKNTGGLDIGNALLC